jgi:two-component system, OmpR family, sensor kinase
MKSLRTRLFCGLVILIIASCVGAGVWAFRWSFDEAIELQDAILLQIGALAIRNHVQAELPAQPGVDAEARVIIKEIPDRAVGTERNIDFPSVPIDLGDGLHTLGAREGLWRVLVRTRPDGSRVAIAQPTAARDEFARDSAIRAILPLLALIPCLTLVIGAVIHYSFRPVVDLAKRLDAEQITYPHHIPAGAVPKELEPFVASINRLLERIAVMLDHQRRFVALAAHELRTPITAISIQAENVDHSQLPQDTGNRFVALKAGVRRTVRLLEQLLALSKYDYGRIGNPRSVKLDGIVRLVITDFIESARARSIDLGCGRLEGAFVEGDSTALTVMVRNLVDNAIRYSPECGRVNLSLYRDGEHVFLLVEDTGPGIAASDLEMIFEPFNRGSRAKGDGTGLGLSIVRRIVDNHAGSISLQNITSPEATGLRVTVILPAAFFSPHQGHDATAYST